ncbi:MAG: hypothetical protein CL685_02535 [Candidatus Magasanikbacteria bacterium]|nr:hypothetical protein [Candidatus Magasanikbacteria bacterium]|tara:strand:- start:2457 stop:3044 length:588 start_codon:yes stop_codon:yes gene_type:complete
MRISIISLFFSLSFSFFACGEIQVTEEVATTRIVETEFIEAEVETEVEAKAVEYYFEETLYAETALVLGEVELETELQAEESGEEFQVEEGYDAEEVEGEEEYEDECAGIEAELESLEETCRQYPDALCRLVEEELNKQLFACDQRAICVGECWETYYVQEKRCLTYHAPEAEAEQFRCLDRANYSRHQCASWCN